MKRIKLYLLISIMLAALLCGCSGSGNTAEPPAAPSSSAPEGISNAVSVVPRSEPEAVEAAKTDDPEQFREEHGGQEASPAEPDGQEPRSVDLNDVPMDVNGILPYSFDEIKEVFLFSEGDILRIYGNPDEEVEFDFTEAIGGKAKGLRYGESYFELDPDGYLYRVRLSDDTVPLPRGLVIGDTLETMLSVLPGKPGPIEEDPQLGKYAVIYGEYAHMSDFALITYDAGGEPNAVVWSSKGTAVYFALEDGRIKYAEYMIPVV